MRINHLIWDCIFCDPEFGGITSFKIDPYGQIVKIGQHKIVHNGSIHIISKNDVAAKWFYSCNYKYRYKQQRSDGKKYWYKGIRGICIRTRDTKCDLNYRTIIPTLYVSSGMVLINTWTDEFRGAVENLYNELSKVVIIKNHNCKICMYNTSLFFHSISKGVFDAMSQYTIDLNYIDMCAKISNMSHIHEEFTKIIAKISEIRFDRDIDLLKSISVHIVRVWNLIIKILQMYHKLTYTIIKSHANPIRPWYYNIHGRIRERIHVKNRYHHE